MKGFCRAGLLLIWGSAALSGCAADLPVGPQAGTENVRVNHTTAYLQQEEPSIAVDGKGRLFVAWKEMNSPAEANRIAFARSTDGGFTWSDPVLEQGSDPWLTLGPSDLLVYAHSGTVVATTTDLGHTWRTMTDVHDRPGLGDKESLASDGRSRLYLAYHNILDDGTVEIVLSASQDGGFTWNPTTLVVEAANQTDLAPVVAARPGGSVYVAWWSANDGDIEAAASSDFGATWGSPARVNSVPGSVPKVRAPGTYPLFPPFPGIAVSSTGVVVVAWPDYRAGEWDIVMARSENYGRTWSSPVRISDTSSGNQWMVALAIDGADALHAAWYDCRTGGTNVMYASSSDLGRTWSASLKVTTAETPGCFNRLGDYLGLAVGPDGTAHLAWTDIRGSDMDIYYASVSGRR